MEGKTGGRIRKDLTNGSFRSKDAVRRRKRLRRRTIGIYAKAAAWYVPLKKIIRLPSSLIRHAQCWTPETTVPIWYADDGAPCHGIREEPRARGHKLKASGQSELQYGGFFGQLRSISPVCGLATWCRKPCGKASLDELHGYILAAANDKRPLLVYAHYRKIEVISDFRKIYYSIEKT